MTRILQTEHGELVVSVTSAMPLVKQLQKWALKEF